MLVNFNPQKTESVLFWISQAQEKQIIKNNKHLHVGVTFSENCHWSFKISM